MNISVGVFLSGFSCFAQLYYFQPLLPDSAHDFSLTATHSSLAVSFSTLGMVFGLLTTMFIADRISRKKLISTGLLSYLTGELIPGVFVSLYNYMGFYWSSPHLIYTIHHLPAEKRLDFLIQSTFKSSLPDSFRIYCNSLASMIDFL